MSKEKLYFKSVDDTFCLSLQGHLEDAKNEELEEITLVEAIPDNINSGYVWCTYEGEVTEREMCKKAECPYYSSKSGRGKCEHRGNLFLPGDEVTFKINKQQL